MAWDSEARGHLQCPVAGGVEQSVGLALAGAHLHARCAPLAAEPLTFEQSVDLAKAFKALGDPVRLRPRTETMGQLSGLLSTPGLVPGS
ncbi:hypothetical protein [Amycolatopsis sp. NPDC051071]|uniref:hypothetical protein n=1 Tax=Amycolatopsis sp. NPDC051071 TaxID=3154637 RepID=UPI003422DF1F